MSLFSWFFHQNNKRNDHEVIAEELERFKRNTMWPTAQVRTNTIVQQHHYINTSHQLNQPKSGISLQEQNSL